jgi:hypothetical protein
MLAILLAVVFLSPTERTRRDREPGTFTTLLARAKQGGGGGGGGRRGHDGSRKAKKLAGNPSPGPVNVPGRGI